MDLTFRFLGSSIPVSGEFGERRRPGAEPLGPVSIGKACTFCAGRGGGGGGRMWVKSSSTAPGGCGPPCMGPRHSGWGLSLSLTGTASFPISVIHSRPHSWLVGG